ncbi:MULTISPECIES: class I SAM-dependent methyltransferase [Eubacteriales]|jgi:arsenite methyltransferase|uniref:class I SAM-dependent methyltransferase n=1 Tax=Eubacteriales TaxID=186802 RepID=UPI001F41F7C6|nr:MULTISPECIES: class I SAM-dependent methyltransferase [Eubacteriales]MCF6466628.1 class I SAM-dependent methyltransferase [Clostridium sp. Cult2]WIV12799.1 class I SAM-dependent methyltransferase [Proteiniborus sp. MB09-C3]
MNNKYDKCVNEWNNIFSKEIPNVPTKSTSGNETLDKGIRWICNGTEKILDFGCGNGTMLFLCAINGTKLNIGIDLSEKAIEVAEKRAEQMTQGEFDFSQGGIDKLKNIDDSEVDAVILSNIIDNLYPDDAEVLMNEVERVLKENGKVLVKVNPYVTTEQISEWNIKVVKDNLLDDGLILWNNTTDEWIKFFERKFDIRQYEEIYYPEYEQYNRMFWLVKRI